MGIPKSLSTFFIGNSPKINHFFGCKGKEDIELPKTSVISGTKNGNSHFFCFVCLFWFVCLFIIYKTKMGIPNFLTFFFLFYLEFQFLLNDKTRAWNSHILNLKYDCVLFGGGGAFLISGIAHYIVLQTMQILLLTIIILLDAYYVVMRCCSIISLCIFFIFSHSVFIFLSFYSSHCFYLLFLN